MERSAIQDPVFRFASYGLRDKFAYDISTYHNMETGSIKATGNPLDLAIASDGFFSVETPLGVRYTKAGNFQIDGEGNLITAEGNQMALDIEMLEPLKIIAEGNASKESCSNAEFINELNNQSDAKTYDKLKDQISKLCK